MSLGVFTGGGGLAGWALLNRTGARQKRMIAGEAGTQRVTQHYRDRIGNIGKADDLLSDYRLLTVTLRAFGLEGDLKNKAFLRQVLESDLSDQRSLANRLSNKSYRRLAEAFGFGSPTGPAVASEGFADRVVTQYVQREFEARVGARDQNLRLALNARRELSRLARQDTSNKTKWYEVLGNPPLRKVFEGAFGFGTAYAGLPIERQLEEFAKAAENRLGSSDISRFSEPDHVEKLVRGFLVRSTVQPAATNRFSIALQLLGGR